METDANVVRALNNPDSARAMQRALKENWQSEQAHVQQAMEESLARMDALAARVAAAKDPEEKAALVKQHQTAQEEMEVRLRALARCLEPGDQ